MESVKRLEGAERKREEAIQLIRSASEDVKSYAFTEDPYSRISGRCEMVAVDAESAKCMISGVIRYRK